MATATEPRPDIARSPAESDLLTTERAAAFLAVSPATLVTWRCTRRVRVPFLRVGRAIRYDRQALARWLASRAEDSVAVEA